jgi:hypothetical protein
MARNGIFEERVAQFKLRELELQRQVAIHEADRKWLLGMSKARLTTAQQPKQQIGNVGSDLEHPIDLLDDDDDDDRLFLKKRITTRTEQEVEKEAVDIVSQDQDTKTTAKTPGRTPQQDKLAINLSGDDDRSDLRKRIPSIKQQAEWEAVVSRDQDMKPTLKISNSTQQEKKVPTLTDPDLGRPVLRRCDISTEQEVEREISVVSQDQDMRTTTKSPSRTPQQKNPAAITAPNLELAFCQRFLTRMHDEKYNKIASYFHHPINEEVNEAPDYFKIIKQPIALSDIQRKLTQGEYSTSDAVKLDLDRMLDNCRVYHTYHPNSDAAYEAGKKMAHIIGGTWAAKKRWVAARETREAQSPRKRRLSFGIEDHRAVRNRTSTSMTGSSERDGTVRNTPEQIRNPPTNKRRLSPSSSSVDAGDHYYRQQTKNSLDRTSKLGSSSRDGDIKSFMLRATVEDTTQTQNEDEDKSEETPSKTLRRGQQQTASTLIVDVPTTDEDELEDEESDEQPRRKILRRGGRESAAARLRRVREWEEKHKTSPYFHLSG